MPELLHAEGLPVATRDQAHVRHVRRVADRYAGGELRAHWIGTEPALGRFRAERGAAADVPAVESTLSGRTADGAALVRTPTTQARGTGDGAERVVGLGHTAVRMQVPESAARIWDRADAVGRAELEAVLVSGLERGLTRLVSDNEVVQRRVGGRRETEAAVGFAGVATVEPGPPSREGGPSTLTVVAAVVGVQRRDGQIVGALDAAITSDAALDAAERHALQPLAAHLVERGYGPSADGTALESRGSVDGTAPPEIPYEEVTVEDPLERHRTKLGDKLHSRIDWLASHLAAEKEQQTTEQLLARRAELGEPFERIDGAAALEAHRLEERRRVVEAEGDKQERWSRTLEERLKRPQRAKTRQGLIEQANQKTAAVERLRGEWQDLKRKDAALNERHPLVWYRDYGGPASEEVAIDRVLASRREHELVNAVERSVAAIGAEQPESVVERLGSAPERGTPEREAWDGLVRRGERARLMAERDGSDPLIGDRERRKAALDAEKLRDDEQRWRAARGMSEREVEVVGQER